MPPMEVLNTGGAYKLRGFRPIYGYMWETIQDRAGNNKSYALYRTMTAVSLRAQLMRDLLAIGKYIVYINVLYNL